MDGSAFWVAALLAVGLGSIFLWADWSSRPSRALALCLIVIGLRLSLVPTEHRLGSHGFWIYQIGSRTLETVSILAGIEWARRVAADAGAKLKRTVGVLFRVSQGITLLYGLLVIGYVVLAPETASTDATGLIRMHGWGWALIPVLAIAILLSTIALIIVRFTRRDPAESLRLRALMVATPFLLTGLVVSREWVPLLISFGLLIFLSGSVHYLIIQGQRGASMRQFISPEIARLLSMQGMEQAMRRERREISIVICDLRGFTAYAREHDSDGVVGLLERYYRVVGQVSLQHRGTVKDHAGDGVLILVGAPLPDRRHAVHAVRLALELRTHVGAFLHEAGVELGIGIGVATGDTTIGALRGAGRLEYAAVGTAVNLAARLCQRAADGEVLADQRTCDALADDVRVAISPQAPEVMKGFAEAVPVYALVNA
ncbi:MAG: adenylate/guanylate cyclase protein [Hydrocarboniphaga sp.]|uniref:adenylate/guanylate cyclase domain-containing protein n=1 Tax=Hydrocarboniphaga sp. TaxID=2033016 RepID=UPI00262FFD79|nr:adenylate/guanylate cyclase domain-containing protein [Hydrocarboniphaga sp.]MDB5972011.1 adenylate/guanylate cyclase protein [Hydrocarboniphaga sp.]